MDTMLAAFDDHCTNIVSDPNHSILKRSVIVLNKLPYLAVVNRRRKSELTGDELAKLAEFAKISQNITDLKVRKSNITFNTTANEINKIRKVFGDKVIIEVNKEIKLLR